MFLGLRIYYGQNRRMKRHAKQASEVGIRKPGSQSCVVEKGKSNFMSKSATYALSKQEIKVDR